MQRPRPFLGLFLIFLVAICTGAWPSIATSAQMAGPLRILNWKGYGTDEPWVAKAFKAKYGVEIVHDYFTSNEELLTKLRTSPGTYDAVLPNNAYYTQAVKERLIQPIDVTKIPNYKYEKQALIRMSEFNQGDKVYGVPWTWGATAVAYNTQAVKHPVDSIKAFWDPEFKGQVGWWDDYLNSIQFAALALGQDPNNPSDLAAIKQKLMALKGQIRTFWTAQDQFYKLFAAKTFSLGVFWSGAAVRGVRFYKLPLAFVIPKDGAIGWVDAWAIPTNAPHEEAALAWINYVIGPDFFVPWDKEKGATAPANEESMRDLPVPFTRQLLGDPAVVKRLVFFRGISEDQRKKYLQLWEEVKVDLSR
jgi:spermidine/putrescine transport system substrate-binding protein